MRHKKRPRLSRTSLPPHHLTLPQRYDIRPSLSPHSHPTDSLPIETLPFHLPLYTRADNKIPANHAAAVLLHFPVPISPKPSNESLSMSLSTACRTTFCNVPSESREQSRAVFAKHWDASHALRGNNICCQDVTSFLEANDFPDNNRLLSVAIVDRFGTDIISIFDVDMLGHSIPLAVIALLNAKALSLHYLPDHSVLQFVLHVDMLRPPSPRVRFLLTCFLPWLVNFCQNDAAVMPHAFGKEWALGAVRRLPTDEDAEEYSPFLKKVSETRALNVSLRGYQKRAVAWMLSREASDPGLLQDLVWQRTARLADVCAVKGDGVKVAEYLSFNPVFGDVWLGKAADFHGLQHIGRGGLLCDEMGLGKTAELMQLVLCNKMEDGRVVDSAGEGHDREEIMCRLCSSPVISCIDLDAYVCLECERKFHRPCIGSDSTFADRYGYVCLDCSEKMGHYSSEDTDPSELPMSKATLVIIPTTLLLQWQNEIKNHVREALSVRVFLGLSETGYIPQRDFLTADVVLTTYDALRSDINQFKALRRPRANLRHRRRYRPTPVPLLTMRWHRVALDESQMLGTGGNSQAAQMASYLHAKYRWCVTGTPISRKLYEIVPMLNFLQLRGGSHAMEWDAIVNSSIFSEDEQRLVRSLRKVMWRSLKGDVEAEELKLPPQITDIVRTNFGPVEKYHYSSLQETVRNATPREQASSNHAHTISNDLLTMLRQACCHPQIGSSGRALLPPSIRQVLRNRQGRQSPSGIAEDAAKRAESPVDMNSVLEALVMKARLDCQDALRTVMAQSNGLSGVQLLQHSVLSPSSSNVEFLVSAIRIYREALTLAEQNKELVKMDRTQRMHILFNLHEALQEVGVTRRRLSCLGRTEALGVLSGVGTTLRDADLLKEVGEIRTEYVSEAQNELIVATADYEASRRDLDDEPLLPRETTPDDEGSDNEVSATEARVTEAVASEADGNEIGANQADESKADADADIWMKSICGKQNISDSCWWEVALAMVQDESTFLDRLVHKLIDAIPGSELGIRTLANRLHSFKHINFVVHSELRALQKARVRLVKALLKLPGSLTPTEADITESGLCSKCRENGVGPACKHCRSEHLFKDVERRMYSLRETENHELVELDESGAYEDDDNWERQEESGCTTQNTGLQFQGEVETILLQLASIIRKFGTQDVQDSMNGWLSTFNQLKKEHACAKKVFEAQRTLLARMDEVNMSLKRSSVLEKDEDISLLTEYDLLHRFPRATLPARNVEFTNGKAMAEADLGVKRGSLVYLLSLRSAAQESEDTSKKCMNDGIKHCAVCLAEFDVDETRIAVFVCGHAFCCDCTLLMIKKQELRRRVQSIACPTCRVRCPIDEISFTVLGARTKNKDDGGGASSSCSPTEQDTDVDMESVISPSKKGKEGEEKNFERRSIFYDGNAAVRGLVGAKCSAIIRLLRGIWQVESKRKVLIFSEWQGVLEVISTALDVNGIMHLNGGGAQRSIGFAKMVDKFKTSLDLNVLLLPLRRAGAGLNLTEARHVILAEPSMNVSLEAQAVGRVHRIGQMHSTYVHRVIVNNTIEDKILEIAASQRALSPNQQGDIRLQHVLQVPTDETV